MVVSRHPHLRAYASCVAVGLAGMIFASCMLAELARFDPVYRSVFYLSGRPKINKLVAGSLLSKVLVSAIPGGSLVAGPANFLVEQISGGLISIDSDDAGSLPSVDLTIPVRVWNPNPYRVTIKPMRPGSGYFINPDIKIATVNLAAATFDEGIGEDGYSVGELNIRVVTQLDLQDFLAMANSGTISDLSDGYIDLLYEYDAMVTVQPVIFWKRVSLEKALTTRCRQGVNLFTQEVARRAICGETWEQPRNPRGAATATTDARPSEDAAAVTIDSQDIDDAQGAVKGLRGLAACILAASVALLGAPGAHVLVVQRRARAAEADLGAAEAVDPGQKRGTHTSADESPAEDRRGSRRAGDPTPTVGEERRRSSAGEPAATRHTSLPSGAMPPPPWAFALSGAPRPDVGDEAPARVASRSSAASVAAPRRSADAAQGAAAASAPPAALRDGRRSGGHRKKRRVRGAQGDDAGEQRDGDGDGGRRRRGRGAHREADGGEVAEPGDVGPMEEGDGDRGTRPRRGRGAQREDDEDAGSRPRPGRASEKRPRRRRKSPGDEAAARSEPPPRRRGGRRHGSGQRRISATDVAEAARAP